MKFLRALLLFPFAVATLFGAARVATPVSEIAVAPGFKVELVRSADPTEGSWIAMCKDNKGRLIISPQDRQPMLRVTLSSAGAIEKIEKIDLKIGTAMGLLYAFDSLYVSGIGPDGPALYRLTDTNGDDQYDKIEMLKKFEGATGEHGSHALVLGPDNMIYYINGNFVKVPGDISPNSPHKNFKDDVILPRGEDGNGFGRGLKPPGGFIMRGDKDGKNWELYAAGMRNTYDFAFNNDGEIVAFDSDMEWDWSMPWYRPIRIYHLVSGGEYGFREGTAKWPAYYPDDLPPAMDVGIGSPTGVIFGYGARFPAKYQNACYVMDWSYGRIFAIHLTPQGSTYSATKETFIKGKPLNVTDMVVGNDGALYFMTGGRNTQSGLYRVSYVGNDSVVPAPKDNLAHEARALRKKLESFHGHKDAGAIEFAWPHLNSPDRWIRYAARIAIEAQPSETWAARALSEETVDGGITALLALARVGDSSNENDLFRALGRLHRKGFSDEQMLSAVRVIEVAISRMGHPEEEAARGIVRALDPMFPSGKPQLDRELAQILIYLEAPDIVGRCLAVAKAAPVFEDQMFYMFHLRTVKTGWSRGQREQYFAWFNEKHNNAKHPAELVNYFTEAGREYSDGASFPKFIANAKQDAIAALTDAERGELADVITGKVAPKAAAAPAHAFVKEWKTADLLEDVEKLKVTATPNGRVVASIRGARDFNRGKEAFTAAQCIACHRMRDDGGSIGPDLTAIAQRFTPRDILESMTEPSKVVSEQFAATDFVLKNGDEVTGRIVEETDQKYVVLTNPLQNGKTDVKKSDVTKKELAKLSPMPEGLINVLSKDEILDLIAYMMAAGRETSPLFQR
jgi:putative heme-binding domain-containing protein